MRARILIVTATLLVTGCASNLKMTYHSDPVGAAIYQGQQFMGRCPTVLQYNPTSEQRRAGVFRIQCPAAVWVSGATRPASDVNVNLQKHGYNQYIVLERPRGAAGYEQDLNFGLSYQQNMILQQQAAAQQQAAMNQAVNNLNQSLNNISQSVYQQQQLDLQRQQLYQSQQPKRGTGSIYNTTTRERYNYQWREN
jgi:hypothetical protein